jgi:biotin transport system substrate-specific component
MRVIADILPRELTGYRAVIAGLIGAGAMAASANAAVHLPFTPVPVTLQPFVMLMCGMLLGGRLAALAMLEYLAVGLAGAPVFADFKFGPAAFAGPTAGYLIGFVPAAYVIGLVVQAMRDRSMRSYCVAGIAGIGVLYISGVAWLSIWGGGQFHGLRAWMAGAAPFAMLDLVKVALAATIASERSTRT